MRFTPQKKIIAVIIALTATVVIITAAVILPTIHYTRELDRETYELRDVAALLGNAIKIIWKKNMNAV